MAQKKETLFRRRAVADLKMLPSTVIFSIQQQAIRGTPDLILCVKGHFVSIELKASQDSVVAPLQLHNAERINRAGGFGLIAYPENWEYVFKVLINLSNGETLYDKVEKQAIIGTCLQ